MYFNFGGSSCSDAPRRVGVPAQPRPLLRQLAEGMTGTAQAHGMTVDMLWTLAACCGRNRRPAAGANELRDLEPAALLKDFDPTAVFKERNAMILGMNPRALREKRRWFVYLWPKGHHWSVVLQPAGIFMARIVDDFVHNPRHCFNLELPSEQLFLVYELVIDQGLPILMLSVKTDFDPKRKSVQLLGCIGPMYFDELGIRAISVVSRYRRYSLIGCNCQHFATEFAAFLGAPRNIMPDDEALAQNASDSSVRFAAAGVAVATTAAAGAWGTAVVNGVAGPGTVLATAPTVLATIGIGAGTVGLLGTLALIGFSCGYQSLHDVLRHCPDATSDSAQAPCITMLCADQMNSAHGKTYTVMGKDFDSASGGGFRRNAAKYAIVRLSEPEGWKCSSGRGWCQSMGALTDSEATLPEPEPE